jgi:FkbM family methyltransferase
MEYDPKLIYDLGLHQGEDTEYYLKRGFRVVAVEADEELVKKNQRELQEYIDNGSLVIVHGAISDTSEDTITFYKNPKVSEWGTVVKSWADRNAELGADSIEVNVRVVSLKSLFEKHGIPYYLKIDIEGMDFVALKILLHCPVKPSYISFESEKVYWNKLIDEFELLEELGYNSFNVVEQSGVSTRKIPPNSIEGKVIIHQFKSGSSGLFGSDLGTSWYSKYQAIERYKTIFKLYQVFGDKSIFQKIYLFRFFKAILQRLIKKPLPGWYDTHARLKK